MTIATENIRERIPDIKYADTPQQTLDASIALVVTDWPESRSLDEEFDAMITPVVVDGCHAINRHDGIVYGGNKASALGLDPETVHTPTPLLPLLAQNRHHRRQQKQQSLDSSRLQQCR